MKIVFLAVVLLMGLCCDNQSNYKQVKNDNAEIDLTNVDFTTQNIKLNGNWEFFWNELVSPEDLKNGIATDKRFIKVPGAWNNYKLDNKALPADGHATYRINLKFSKSDIDKIFGIRVNDIGSAYKLWVNDKLILENGVVSENKEEYVPDVKTRIGSFIPLSTDTNIVMQIQNVNDKNGGMWNSATIGSFNNINDLRNKMIIYDMFLFGATIVMAIYHLGLFLLRRKDRSSVYFGMLCLLIAIRIIITGDKVVYIFMSGIPYEILLKIDSLIIFFGTAFFAAFFYYLFPASVSRYFHKSIFVLSVIFSVLVLFLPQKISSYLIMPFQALIILSSLYIIFSIIHAIIKKTDTAWIALFGFTITALTVLNDILSSNLIINTPFLMPLGIFIFTISYSFIISRKFLLAFNSVEQISMDLKNRTDTIEVINKELIKTNEAYHRFVPKEIMTLFGRENILDVKLGDSIKKEMTIMFSDIRSFTKIMEQMTSEESFAFLNTYMGRMGPIIRKHNGFIDKFIGDSILALFDNADNALNAAIDMQKEIISYNLVRVKEGDEPIGAGIGINTGDLILGTIGESDRMDATVVSDSVNLASRLEGLTKIYKAGIIISENLLFRLSDPTVHNYRFLDKVKVRGKVEPVSVFEILDVIQNETDELKETTRAVFEKAIYLYHGKEFREALKIFKKIYSVNKTDKGCELYIRRCIKNIKFSLPDNWDGIEVQENKVCTGE